MSILSIQSHVVYGYAGNTAAVFPLQRLGREVWAVNTVEFSNHTGYGNWSGKVLGADLVCELVSGLNDRGALNSCAAVLSGYLGDASVGNAIIEAVKKTKNASCGALYCCDPVMGDVGRGLYVKPDIPDIFKNSLIKLADIVCPNQFELEVLTNTKIKNISDAVKSIDILHNMGPSIVLLTSFFENTSELSMLASNKTDIFKVTTPQLPLGNGIAGTGDMTAAVFLSHYLDTNNLQEALFKSTASVFCILEESYKSSLLENNVLTELKIIQNQEQLINPIKTFKVVKI